MAHLLILEDDEGIRSALTMALEDEGHEVVAFGGAEEALAAVEERAVDLMLVDLMLGGIDGYSFIRRVRPTSDVPIIVLSARVDSDDIVAALEAGADDYVSKPFVLKEVLARLRVLLRRRTPPEPAADSGPDPDRMVLDAAEPALVLDAGAGMLRRGDEPVHLTVTEYRLLCDLAEHAGKVRSRSALLDSVWDHGYFGDERIVDVHIRRLRTKTEREPASPELIVTVRGLGYRLDPRRP